MAFEGNHFSSLVGTAILSFAFGIIVTKIALEAVLTLISTHSEEQRDSAFLGGNMHGLA